MKKPKLLRLPKMPKAKTPQALKKHLERLNHVEKANEAKLKPWRQAIADKEKLIKAIDAKKARIRGL